MPKYSFTQILPLLIFYCICSITCAHSRCLSLSLSIYTLHTCVNTYPLYFFLDLLEEAAHTFIPSTIISTVPVSQIIFFNPPNQKMSIGPTLPSSPKSLFIFHDCPNNISFFSGQGSYSGIHAVFSYISRLLQLLFSLTVLESTGSTFCRITVTSVHVIFPHETSIRSCIRGTNTTQMGLCPF